MQNIHLSDDFNENDPKYQCCCGSCHVVTGVKLFLGLYIIGSIFLIFTGEGLMLTIVMVIVASCTIKALNNEKNTHLWPFIIVTMISVVFWSVMLFILILNFFFDTEPIRRSIKNYYGKEGIDLSEDQIVEMMKMAYAILFSAILVLLTYNGWVLRVLLGCKRYFKDKSKAKISNSTEAAPRMNAFLLTFGQVQPPPYEHSSKFYCSLMQNAGYQQQSASSKLQQQPAPGHSGVGWGYQQGTVAPQQPPSTPSNAHDAKVRPLSYGMAASPNPSDLGDNGGSSPIMAQNERRKREEALVDQLRVIFPNITQDALREYVNEYRNQLPNRSLEGLSVEVALEGVVLLIANKQASWNKQNSVHPSPTLQSMTMDTFAQADGNVCTACRDSLRGAKGIELRCLHRFHTDCVKDWLTSQQTCPSCGQYSPSFEDYPELS